ncbi:hypothetical protein LTR15_001115 [Elasticomyces elasticus]|nr:hypothetical protein LTR15_001115 [Elasticomyces elasticus]
MDYDHDQMEGIIYHGLEAHITNLGRSRAKGNIDQDSAALQDTHSRFLSLPRELRDLIYEYTSWDITFRGQDTEDEAFFPGEITNTTSLDVTVTDVADLGLLHASHQVHDEYVACVRARSALLITTPNGFPILSKLDVSANIPNAVSSNVKKIEIRHYEPSSWTGSTTSPHTCIQRLASRSLSTLTSFKTLQILYMDV